MARPTILFGALFAAALILAGAARAEPPASCADRTSGAPCKDAADLARKLTAKRTSKMPQAAISAIERAKSFKVAIRRPDKPSGETFVLLHGSGGDETTLMPIAERIAPHAVLIGIAGRVTQDGTRRWYQRITETTFDQDDIRHEADAFHSFLTDAVADKTLDLKRTTFIGYSNGANLLAAMSVLHPGTIGRAVLLRPMPVLDPAPMADLTTTRFLAVIGKTDLTYAPFGSALEAMLRARGARVEAHQIEENHGLGDLDVKVVSEWLAASDLAMTSP